MACDCWGLPGGCCYPEPEALIWDCVCGETDIEDLDRCPSCNAKYDEPEPDDAPSERDYDPDDWKIGQNTYEAAYFRY